MTETPRSQTKMVKQLYINIVLGEMAETPSSNKMAKQLYINTEFYRQ